jgi:sulfur-carrier protein
MKVKIMTFGYITEVVGENILYFENAADIISLRAGLEEKFPRLKTLEYKIAVNRELVNGNAMIDSKSEVALLPPFAGG